MSKQHLVITSQPSHTTSARSDLQLVNPSYFDTLELPVVSGRAFTPDDRSGTTPVCIVNEAFARRHFPGRNPVGERVRVGLDAAAREMSEWPAR